MKWIESGVPLGQVSFPKTGESSNLQPGVGKCTVSHCLVEVTTSSIFLTKALAIFRYFLVYLGQKTCQKLPKLNEQN